MTYRHPVNLRVNGADLSAEVAPAETLLSVLRRCWQYHGCRESCGQGVCGTCTVLLDGRAVSSCLVLARLVDGAEIETVEGMGAPGDLSDVQTAFAESGGLQCGFCTPGMVVTATQLLRENPDPSEEEIRHYLAGNTCRCGAYPEIVAAVRAAARARQAAAADAGAG